MQRLARHDGQAVAGLDGERVLRVVRLGSEKLLQTAESVPVLPVIAQNMMYVCVGHEIRKIKALRRAKPSDWLGLEPERGAPEEVPVYDGHALKHGNLITGPALIEQVNTTVFVSAGFDTFCDPMGSFVVHQKGFDVKTRRANP